MLTDRWLLCCRKTLKTMTCIKVLTNMHCHVTPAPTHSMSTYCLILSLTLWWWPDYRSLRPAQPAILWWTQIYRWPVVLISLASLANTVLDAGRGNLCWHSYVLSISLPSLTITMHWCPICQAIVNTNHLRVPITSITRLCGSTVEILLLPIKRFNNSSIWIG